VRPLTVSKQPLRVRFRTRAVVSASQSRPLYVCLRASTSPKLHIRSLPIFVQVTYGRFSVLSSGDVAIRYVLPVSCTDDVTFVQTGQ